MEYVYVYMHPEHPYLYVGRTCDLEKRIKSHDTSDNDNISREYERLLQDASVWYIPLQNKAESTIVEAYLINKYKPYLNKSLNYEGISDSLILNIPEYIKMDESMRKMHIRYRELQDDVSKKAQRLKEMEEIKEELSCTEEKLQALKIKCQSRKRECQIFSDIQNNTHTVCNIWFTAKEVEWIMENCCIDVAFYAGFIDINTGNRHLFKYEKKGETKKGWLCVKETDCGLDKCDWTLVFESNDGKNSMSQILFDMMVGDNKYVSDNDVIPELYLSMLQRELENAKEILKNRIRTYTAEELIEYNGCLPNGDYGTVDERTCVHVRRKRGKIDNIGVCYDYRYEGADAIRFLNEHKELIFYDDQLERCTNENITFLEQSIDVFIKRQSDIEKYRFEHGETPKAG